jgi:lysophospholipase L1-like esterase
MKKIFIRTLYIAACISIVFACKPKFDSPPAIDKGSLDLTTYVAIGNSITAGYADNALYRKGQENSYAKLLAEQFQLAGGGEFRTPYVSATSVGIGAPPSFSAHLALSYVTDCNNVTSLSPKPVAASGDFGVFASVFLAQGPFNNFGVPGAKSFHVPYPRYGDPNNTGKYNPFFARMTSDVNASMLSDALSRNPTFFSLFIGNNDVLLYALAGAASDSITQTPIFNASVDGILTALTATSPKGVVANIPDITTLPHFTTVPYNGLVLTRQGQVDTLNAGYAVFGITFQLGQNAFIIADASAPGGRRKILSTEYILLSVPQDSLKCYKMGSGIPIPNKYVLTASEISDIKTATDAYNTKLKSAALAHDLAFVDVNSFLKSALTGLTFDGVNVNTVFVSGGAFSLDGVHLTPLGNALLANQFISAINAKYGSTIPNVDVTKYHGVIFP